jgi:FPC/CPF motif-containing protein YcgG
MRENPFAPGNANPPGPARDSFAAEVKKAFNEFVMRPEFPCVGAKAAINSGSYTVLLFDELASRDATAGLCDALYSFTRSTIQNDPHPSLLPQGEGTTFSDEQHGNASALEGRIPLPNDPHAGILAHREGTAAPRKNVDFTKDITTTIPLPSGEGRVRATSEYATFVAIFGRPRELNEIQFEELLWQQLRALHHRDASHFDWDPNVRSDPADPHFSFSFGGQALYVIGLHANSSREARRFPWPALVFNPHEQFERLRAGGKWKRMQETIRSRDLELQGSINPMLSDFGAQSEARQYSGRAVEDNWRAPFPKVAGKCPFAHGT